MQIVILGAGYVGLVTAACFAEFGLDVVCIDSNAEKVAQLQAGKVPVFEPRLEALTITNMAAGRLVFACDPGGYIEKASAIFIAVGTPNRRGDGHADLQYVEQAVRMFAPRLAADRFTVIVTKSTVPVGSCRMVERLITELNPGADFAVCANPEFLRQGSAIGDFMQPDRLVLGIEDDRAAAVMQEIYKPILMIETPLLQTGLETAELIKYAGNAFLAAKVGLINEIADLCEKTGADILDVARGIGMDGRIGRDFLQPGPGFGGSCFPKDGQALAKSARDVGIQLRIVEAVMGANERRKQTMAARVVAACGGDVHGKIIAVLGVTFKPNTDDVRASVALDLIPDLQDAGAIIRAYDPAGMKPAATLLDGVTWAQDAYDASNGAHAIVLLTEWEEFRVLNLSRLHELLREPIFVDLRNIYDPEVMAALGFAYSCLGRSVVTEPRQAVNVEARVLRASG